MYRFNLPDFIRQVELYVSLKDKNKLTCCVKYSFVKEICKLNNNGPIQFKAAHGWSREIQLVYKYKSIIQLQEPMHQE